MVISRVLDGGRILRNTLAERVVHWVAGISYLYLLATGLAFFDPFLFRVTGLLGGAATARAWHPWAGVIFVIAVVWMYAIWHEDMRITDVDRAWSRAIGYYIRNEDENLPPASRFNAGQKQLFWLMFYGGLLLLASGLVLWLPEYLPWSFRWLRYTAVLVHPLAALATIGGFIVHFYMGTAVARGGFTSIIRGEVSQAWARMHHRLWLNQILRESGEKK